MGKEGSEGIAGLTGGRMEGYGSGRRVGIRNQVGINLSRTKARGRGIGATHQEHVSDKLHRASEFHSSRHIGWDKRMELGYAPVGIYLEQGYAPTVRAVHVGTGNSNRDKLSIGRDLPLHGIGSRLGELGEFRNAGWLVQTIATDLPNKEMPVTRVLDGRHENVTRGIHSPDITV